MSSSARAMAESGVWLAGFSTTGQPAAMAGATLWATRLSGKLNGVMAPTTPIGTRRVKPSLPSPGCDASSGTISPASVRASAAANGNVLTARSASTRAVLIGLAASAAIVRANSSVRSARSAAAAVEDLGPLPRRQRSLVQRGLGGGDGPVDVGRGAGRHGPDDGAVVGRVDLDDVVGGEALASER